MEKVIDRMSHRRASQLVAGWKHGRNVAASLYEHKLVDGVSHRLQFVDVVDRNGHTVIVSFHPVQGHPEWMRVMSSNWRYEDEPNDIYSIGECRAFYRDLVAAGFEAF